MRVYYNFKKILENVNLDFKNSRVSLIRRTNETLVANCERQSTRINSFMVPHGDFGWKTYLDDVIKERNDHVEQVLSITPSDYIRHYREKKVREEGLASCIQSFTSLLEHSLNNNEINEKLSKEAIERSLKAIKENFKNELSDFIDLPSYNLHGLRSMTSPIDLNMLMLRHTAFPSLLPSTRCEEKCFSFANGDTDSSAQRHQKNNEASPEKIPSIEDYFIDVEDDTMNWLVNEDVNV